MAEFHFHKNVVSRSKGHSACAAGAYMTGTSISQSTNVEGIEVENNHNYTRKVGVYDYFVVAPNKAPEWVNNIEELLNEIEKMEKRKDSQICFTYDLAIPTELPKSQWSNIAKEYAEKMYKTKGLVTLVAVHDDDLKNPHFHMLVSMRSIDEKGFSIKKDTSLNEKQFLEYEREFFANICNKYLMNIGSMSRVDHRSYKDRGIDIKATKHLGKNVHINDKIRSIMKEKGIVLIDDYNKSVMQINAAIAKEMPEHFIKRLMPADKNMVSMSEIDREAFKLASSEGEYHQIRSVLNEYAGRYGQITKIKNEEYYHFDVNIKVMNETNEDSTSSETYDSSSESSGKSLAKTYDSNIELDKRSIDDSKKILDRSNNSKYNLNKEDYIKAKQKLSNNPRQYFGEFDFKAKGRDYISNAKIDINGKPTGSAGKVYLYTENSNIHCHKTGTSISVLDYYADSRRISINEAVKEINGDLQIRVNANIYSYGNSKEVVHIEYSDEQKILVKEAIYDYATLPENRKLAQKYLTEERSIAKEIAEKMDVGFIANRSSMKQYLLNKEGLNIDKYTKVISRAFGTYNKLILPIRNIQKQIIGLTARATDQDSQIKYVNSSYAKNNNLTGIENIEGDKAILVEGMLDVYSLKAAGIDNVLGLGGISISKQQIALLRGKFVKNIILALDNDNAGNIASNNISKQLLKEGFNVSVINIRGGKDLDEVLRNQGIEAVKSILNESKLQKITQDNNKLEFTDTVIGNIAHEVTASLIRKNVIFNKEEIRLEVNKICKDFSDNLKASVLDYLTTKEMVNIGNDNLNLSKWYIRYDDINHKDINQNINKRLKGKLNLDKLKLLQKVKITDVKDIESSNNIRKISKQVIKELKGEVFSELELKTIINKVVAKNNIQQDIKQEVLDNVILNNKIKLLDRKKGNDHNVYCLATQYALEDKAYNKLSEYSKGSRKKRPIDNFDNITNELNQGQKEFVKSVFSENNVTIIEGKPGTGKTTAIQKIAEIAAVNKQKIYGLTSYGIAAKNLSSTGIEAKTIESWKYNDDWKLDKNSILIVDEAGVVNSEDMNKIITAANDSNTHLVIMGDKLQSQPIHSGQLFSYITKNLPTIKLDEIVRQKSTMHIQAINKIYEGKISESLEILENNKDIIKCSDMSVAREKAAIEHIENVNKNINHVTLAVTNKEVEKINQLTRSKLVKYNLIKDTKYISVLGKNIGVNEKIIFLKNDYNIDVRNGQIGKVIAIDHNQSILTIESNNMIYKIDCKLYNHIDYSYAITIDKSQGSTFDSASLIATGNIDASRLLVAISRHKDKFKILMTYDTHEWSKNISYRIKEPTLAYNDDNKYLNNIKIYIKLKEEIKGQYTRLNEQQDYIASMEIYRSISDLNIKKHALYRVISNNIESHKSYILESNYNIVNDFFGKDKKYDKELLVLNKFMNSEGIEKLLAADSLRTKRENKIFYDHHFINDNTQQEIIKNSESLIDIDNDHYQVKYRKLANRNFGLLENNQELKEQTLNLYKQIRNDKIILNILEQKIAAYNVKKEKYEEQINLLKQEKLIANNMNMNFDHEHSISILEDNLAEINKDTKHQNDVKELNLIKSRLGRFVYDKDFTILKDIYKQIEQQNYEESLYKLYKNKIKLDKEYNLQGFELQSYNVNKLYKQLSGILEKNIALSEQQEELVLKYLGKKHGLIESIDNFKDELQDKNNLNKYNKSLRRIYNIQNNYKELDNLKILSGEHLKYKNEQDDLKIASYINNIDIKGANILLDNIIKEEVIDNFVSNYSSLVDKQKEFLNYIENKDLKFATAQALLTGNKTVLNNIFKTNEVLMDKQNLLQDYLKIEENLKVGMDDLKYNEHYQILEKILKEESLIKQQVSYLLEKLTSDSIFSNIKDNISESVAINQFDKALSFIEKAKLKGINLGNIWKSKTRLESEEASKQLITHITALKSQKDIKGKIKEIYNVKLTTREIIIKNEHNILLKETALSIYDKYQIVGKDINEKEFLNKYTNTHLLNRYITEEIEKGKTPEEAMSIGKVKFMIHQERYTNKDWNEVKDNVEKGFNEIYTKNAHESNIFKQYMKTMFDVIKPEVSQDIKQNIDKSLEIVHKTVLQDKANSWEHIIAAEEINHDIHKNYEVNHDQLRYRQKQTNIIKEYVHEMHHDIQQPQQKMKGD